MIQENYHSSLNKRQFNIQKQNIQFIAHTQQMDRKIVFVCKTIRENIHIAVAAVVDSNNMMHYHC